MDSRSGKKIRLGRLRSGAADRGLVVAYSHGVLWGPFAGGASLAEIRARFASLAGVDGVILAPGLVSPLEDHFVGRQAPALVLHIDWMNWERPVLAPRYGVATSIAGIEDAAAAGADAVMSYLFVGQDDPALERLEIERNAQLARRCDALGLGLVIEPRAAIESRDPAAGFSVPVMAMYARIAAEIGADIVKCLWPGDAEALARIVEGCPAPLYMAGGEADDEETTLGLARTAMAAGARGLVFGRRVVTSPNPAAIVRGLAAIVHGTEPGN